MIINSIIFFNYHLTYILSAEDYCLDDGRTHTAKEIHSYLGRVLYGRRNKMDPLWNTLVIAGVENGNSFVTFSFIF